MHKANVQKILTQIKEDDIVLDIGGWFRPFNRANWVIDFMPYETRGKGGAQGEIREYFSKHTWIQRDICDRKPLPFRDKEIDFIICSHSLEDFRDPVFVCSEICRIGKRGYIEAPSEISELSFGIESRYYAGYSHHRWIIEIQNNKVIFLAKRHFIHGRWKYHFPYSWGQHLPEDKRIQWFFWEGHFDYEEKAFVGDDEIMDYIEILIRSQHAYSSWRYSLELLRDLAKSLRDAFFKTKILLY